MAEEIGVQIVKVPNWLMTIFVGIMVLILAGSANWMRHIDHNMTVLIEKFDTEKERVDQLEDYIKSVELRVLQDHDEITKTKSLASMTKAKEEDILERLRRLEDAEMSRGG